MLIRVDTIHQPNNLSEAAQLVNDTVRPLYGGVALHRESPHHVTAVVNLSKLGLDHSNLEEHRLTLGSMLSLEAARQSCLDITDKVPNAAFLAEMIRQEAPITLRNTMTLSDVLIERKSNSVLLTALVALDALVHQADGAHHPVGEWLKADERDVRPALITGVSILRGTVDAKHGYQKVARTPADDPIVGAVVYVEHGRNGSVESVRLALCGVADSPILVESITARSVADLATALEGIELNPIGDHWGSAEYRIAMGRLMARRVLERAL